LIYRNVGTRDHQRALPSGLDVPAAFGSERAYTILQTEGQTAYENYDKQLASVRGWTSGLTTADWTETLYNGWLYGLLPLLDVSGANVPVFMRAQAWQDKQLNAYLGSWAELKHDTILYAKQAYSEMGGGPPPPAPVPPLNYVEPVPEVYARLAALTKMTRSGLDSRGLLDAGDQESLTKLEDLAQALQAMAEKELRGEALTDDEQSRIRFYGGELEHFVMASADPADDNTGGTPYMDEEPQAAVIADVATDPNTQRVFEVGVGRINEIHVVVPVTAPDGTTYLQVAKGGVFAYYEFPWALGDRLTDEKWRAMLVDGSAPAVPDWTSSFTAAEGENAGLQLGVFEFQKTLINAYWWLDPAQIHDGLGSLYAQEIDALVAANNYIGHQLVATHFRSFDRQSDDVGVVTVRETWTDTLYKYTGEPQYYDDPVAGVRGPYDLDVTYTLNLKAIPPRVTNVVYANQPPEWTTP
jgi:hypothetical protein